MENKNFHTQSECNIKTINSIFYVVFNEYSIKLFISNYVGREFQLLKYHDIKDYKCICNSSDVLDLVIRNEFESLKK